MSAVQIQIQGSVSVAGGFHLFLSALTSSFTEFKGLDQPEGVPAHRDTPEQSRAVMRSEALRAGLRPGREEQTDLKMATSDLHSATPTKTQ